MFDHDVKLLVHVIIRYAQNTPALRFHEGIARAISRYVFVGPMGNTVHFDDELLSHASKIDDEWTDRMLSTKVMADPIAAQFGPKDCFCVRQAAAQGFSENS
ncbi:MAG TPA: hypothetical protein VGM36_02140 [Rhizomicrobium sp.]